MKYVENRWRQLSELDGKHGDTLVKYLMLTNSGGAAATLGYMGASKGEWVTVLPWAPAMLGLFVLGVILLRVRKSDVIAPGRTQAPGKSIETMPSMPPPPPPKKK